MEIEPFALERWLARYEHGADVVLAESGVRSLPASRFDTDPGDLGYVVPTNGDPGFRATLAERYGRSADEVLFTCGTQEANFLAFLSLVGPDDHAVVVTPTYGALSALPAAFGSATRVELEPPRWTLDVDAVADAMEPETRLVVLANPNNPTGRYHAEEVVEALYDLAADADAYLLCDEVYRMLADRPHPPVASLGPHGLSTAGLSKAYGLAGLRFGWLVGDADVIERAWRWKDYTTISPSRFGQHVARQALGRREGTILRENRALARRNRDVVSAFLEERGVEWYEPVGVQGFPTVPAGFDGGDAFCRTVVEDEGVVLAPGEAFGHRDRFRIGFGVETARLRRGLDRIGRVIDRSEG
ncbi:MAG: pyridoxal phosphate-dependent aminotransferase [Salinigranum sp.]